jgi:hypothetical protein
LPHPSDQYKSADTLPRPELNPLLNSLLAENMGRWAEVYFTSPPEKREEAVLELLHKLEAENSQHESTADSSAPLPANPVEELTMPSFSAERFVADDPPQSVACAACGHENPASHQFCGMCGKKVIPANHGEENRSDGFPDDRDIREPIEAESPNPELGRSSAFIFDEPVRHQFDEPIRNENELSLFQSARESGPSGEEDWAFEPPPSRPYRLYIGMALAAVILVLGYMAWRSAQATSQSSHEASLAPPMREAATQPATDAAKDQPAGSAGSAKTDRPAPAAPAPVAPARTESPVPARSHAATVGDNAGAAAEKKRAAAEERQSDMAEGQPPPSTGNGGEELAMAQRYLSGANGGRNSAVAAQWLWKSISKHNAEATLVLADLYLRGDGVSKNCDQARVLLDTAARKNIAGAGERLRNLQAFGCQ